MDYVFHFFSGYLSNAKWQPEKINALLSFFDPSIESYIGYKLEILYLLSILEQDFSNSINLKDESKNLYKQIQEGDKISAFIKERVKKINEFQKYN